MARLAVPSAFAPFDAVRGGVTAAGLALGWVWTIDRTGAVQRARQAGVPNRLDLAILAVVLGVSLAARIVLGADPWLLVVIAIAVSLLYSRFRRGLNRAIDRVFMAETRERAAIGAIETERARVARDLHDEPLQELSGVIKKLELMPEAAREAAALRGVAQHLRDVATELYPPHLRDLGLGPALEHLVHQANISASVPVELDLSDAPGIRAEDRLPGDIEVALYRITQEAIANAQRHSGGSLVQVTASLSGGRATLVVQDDGIGIKPSAIEAAQRDGRFGMASMRQRAAGISSNPSSSGSWMSTKPTSTYEYAEYVAAALERGASGYLLQDRAASGDRRCHSSGRGRWQCLPGPPPRADRPGPGPALAT